MTLGTIVLTGAAGRVGAALRAPLRAEAPNEVVHRTDLSDPAGTARVVGGADAVVHLAGVSDEAWTNGSATNRRTTQQLMTFRTYLWGEGVPQGGDFASAEFTLRYLDESGPGHG